MYISINYVKTGMVILAYIHITDAIDMLSINIQIQIII